MGLYGGVDPGFTGAIASLESVEGEELVEVWDMPIREQRGRPRIDRTRVNSMARTFGEERSLVAVEAVGAVAKPGTQEGAVSMFRFGQGQGEVLGVLEGIGARVLEVPASVWKVRLGLQRMCEKEVCRLAAKLWPGVTFFGPRGGPLHGRAEAVFLAAYARLVATGRGLKS